MDCGNKYTLVDNDYLLYGGLYNDEARSIFSTSDNGFISFVNTKSDYKAHNGDDIKNRGNNDYMIVKYDKAGFIEWEYQFGTSDYDGLYDLLEYNDYYYVVGVTNGNDYLIPDTYKNNFLKTVILKFSKDGKLVKQKIMEGNVSSFEIKKIKLINNVMTLFADDRGNSNICPLTGTYGDIDTVYFNMDEELNCSNFKRVGGSGQDIIKDFIYDSLGNYIMVGASSSNDGVFSGQNNGNPYDMSIIKIDKNGNIVSKLIGGEFDDRLYSIVELSDGYLVSGFTTSSTGDFSELAKGKNDGVVIKLDKSLNVVFKKVIGGSNSDSFYDIIKKNDGFIICGNSFSIDKNFNLYRYGNSDATYVYLDNNYNETDKFKIHYNILNKPKSLVINYGTSIADSSNKYKHIYTTNNTMEESNNWCETYNDVDNSNYKSAYCLYPMNNDDLVPINNSYRSDSKADYISLGTNSFSINDYDVNNWLRLIISCSWGSSTQEISNIKIKFYNDNNYYTFEQAVTKDYIYPLVTVGSPYEPQYNFPSPYNLLSGGSSGTGFYGRLSINLKTKLKIEKITLDSTYNFGKNGGDGFYLYELKNFEMSLSPAE